MQKKNIILFSLILLTFFGFYSCKKVALPLNEKSEGMPELSGLPPVGSNPCATTTSRILGAQMTPSLYPAIKLDRITRLTIEGTLNTILEVPMTSPNTYTKKTAYIWVDKNDNYLDGRIEIIVANSFTVHGQLNGTVTYQTLQGVNITVKNLIGGKEAVLIVPTNVLQTVVVTASYPSSGVSITTWNSLLGSIFGYGNSFNGVGEGGGGGGNGIYSSGGYFYYFGMGGGNGNEIGMGGSGNSGNAVCPIAPVINTSALMLKNNLGLNQNEFDWLNSNVQISNEIYSDFNYFNTIDDNEAAINEFKIKKISSKFVIRKLTEGTIESTDPGFLNYMNELLANEPNFGLFPLIMIKLNYNIVKEENPDWPSWKILREASIETMHNTLDLGGMIPIFGEVFDLTNAGLYTFTGDHVQAGLSLASTIPFAGWAASGAKVAKKLLQISGGGKTTLKWIKAIKATNGVTLITFPGGSKQLRKILGMLPGDGLFAHHILPQKLFENPLIQKAAAGYTKVVNGVTEHFAFHMNNFTNGMPLSALQHNDGGHSIYITKIKAMLEAVYNSNPNMSIEDANNGLTVMMNLIKNKISDNPNLTLNQIAPLL